MAVVMFKCFECDFASNTMDDVKIHIHLEHGREEDIPESKNSPQLIEITEKEFGQLLQKPATIATTSSIRWSHGMVLHLLQCFKKHQDKFSNAGYTSKKVWDDIAEDFSERYYGVTGYYCYEKWRNLKRTYKNVKKNLRINGGNRCRFLYFNEMEEIHAKSPGLFETTRIRERFPNLSELSDNESTFNTIADVGEAVTSSPVRILPKPAKICRTSVAEKPQEDAQKSEPHCCTFILKELKRMEEAREASERKRHEEKMAVYREILHIKKQKLLMLQKLE